MLFEYKAQQMGARTWRWNIIQALKQRGRSWPGFCLLHHHEDVWNRYASGAWYSFHLLDTVLRLGNTPRLTFALFYQTQTASWSAVWIIIILQKATFINYWIQRCFVKGICRALHRWMSTQWIERGATAVHCCIQYIQEVGWSRWVAYHHTPYALVYISTWLLNIIQTKCKTYGQIWCP